MPAGCWRPSASSSLVITLTMLRTVDSSNCDHGFVGARMRRRNSECHFCRICITSAAASASTRNTSQSSRRSVARRSPFEPASPSAPLSPSLSLLLLFRDPSSAASSPAATYHHHYHYYCCSEIHLQQLIHLQQRIHGGHKVAEKHSLSFSGFSRAINLLFHKLSQQKVNVTMTFIKGNSTSISNYQ